MNQKLIAEIGRTQRLTIINHLKRSEAGLTVNELATLLQMSYMGVKGHCLDLEKSGYLVTWRRAKGTGRPEMLYRLTERAQDLFPRDSNAMTISLLQAANRLYGPAAAEKLLFMTFQEKTEGYQAKVKGQTPAERAKSLVRLRDGEGCMADLSPGQPVVILEHHSPVADLLAVFPVVARLETDMFTKVLGVPVSREERTVAGLYCCRFTLS